MDNALQRAKLFVEAMSVSHPVAEGTLEERREFGRNNCSCNRVASVLASCDSKALVGLGAGVLLLVSGVEHKLDYPRLLQVGGVNTRRAAENTGTIRSAQRCHRPARPTTKHDRADSQPYSASEHH